MAFTLVCSIWEPGNQPECRRIVTEASSGSKSGRRRVRSRCSNSEYRRSTCRTVCQPLHALQTSPLARREIGICRSSAIPSLHAGWWAVSTWPCSGTAGSPNHHLSARNSVVELWCVRPKVDGEVEPMSPVEDTAYSFVSSVFFSTLPFKPLPPLFLHTYPLRHHSLASTPPTTNRLRYLPLSSHPPSSCFDSSNHFTLSTIFNPHNPAKSASQLFIL